MTVKELYKKLRDCKSLGFENLEINIHLIDMPEVERIPIENVSICLITHKLIIESTTVDHRYQAKLK